MSDEWKSKRVESAWVEICMAGDVDEAKRVSQKWCTEAGCCVTVTPTTYVYKYGSEEGFIVRLIHYARFPLKNPEIDLLSKAFGLARRLAEHLDQGSYTVMDNQKSVFFSRSGDISDE